MKKIVVLLLLAFVGAAGWSVGNQLSSDALGMSVGILLGVLAGLPVALLVIAAGRRSERYEQPEPYYPQQQAQAPVIMLMGGQGQPQQWQPGQYPGQQQQYLPGPGQAGQWHSAPASSYDFWDGDQATEDW